MDAAANEWRAQCMALDIARDRMQQMEKVSRSGGVAQVKLGTLQSWTFSHLPLPQKFHTTWISFDEVAVDL